LTVPAIGIGAGPDTDGQVLVWHDLLGLYTDHVPRHTKVYANLSETIRDALQSYASEVRGGSFPATEHASSMSQTELDDAIHDFPQDTTPDLRADILS
jgi:3-methyl-2-oxobutanoate hydroxymethyltransferase